MAGPSKRVQARTLEALAFFSDPARVTLVPGADVTALVGKYARMRDEAPEPAKVPAGSSTAASVHELTETVECTDLACQMAGSMMTHGEWIAEGRRYGYSRPALHRHTRIVPGLVRCPNCDREIQLREWWRHGCTGRGTAA